MAVYKLRLENSTRFHRHSVGQFTNRGMKRPLAGASVVFVDSVPVIDSDSKLAGRDVIHMLYGGSRRALD
jgi:hypothetical protein